MDHDSQNLSLNHPTARQILTIHLGSWRYFAALTLPPLIFVLQMPHTSLAFLLVALILLTHYFCWRLWLDERLFAVLSDNDTAVFDHAMQQLWGKNRGQQRSIAQRWQGARRLLYQTILSTLLLWGVWWLVL